MKRPSFTPEPFDSVVLSGISPPFEKLSQIQRQVAHVLLTRSPLYLPEGFLVRLACVRHAASVRSEPGSNSPIDISCSKEKNHQTGFPVGFPSLWVQSGIVLLLEPVQVRHISYSFFKEQFFSKQEGKLRIPMVGNSCQPKNLEYMPRKKPFNESFPTREKLLNRLPPWTMKPAGACVHRLKFSFLSRLANYSVFKWHCQRKNSHFFAFFQEAKKPYIYLFLLNLLFYT